MLANTYNRDDLRTGMGMIDTHCQEAHTVYPNTPYTMSVCQLLTCTTNFAFQPTLRRHGHEVTVTRMVCQPRYAFEEAEEGIVTGWTMILTLVNNHDPDS